jgi:hypothetical protein
MWCEKCQYGSDHVEFKLDSSGNFQCLQCGTLKQPITKSPFNVSKGRTLGGNKSSGEKPAPKKFTFDQKGGTNSENEYTSGKDIPTYKDKPVEETAEKSVETLVQDTIRQATAVPVAEQLPKQPEKPTEQPVKLPKQPLEPIDESKLTPFVAQPKPVEQEGQNEAMVVEKK